MLFVEVQYYPWNNLEFFFISYTFNLLPYANTKKNTNVRVQMKHNTYTMLSKSTTQRQFITPILCYTRLYVFIGSGI